MERKDAMAKRRKRWNARSRWRKAAKAQIEIYKIASLRPGVLALNSSSALALIALASLRGSVLKLVDDSMNAVFYNPAAEINDHAEFQRR